MRFTGYLLGGRKSLISVGALFCSVFNCFLKKNNLKTIFYDDSSLFTASCHM